MGANFEKSLLSIQERLNPNAIAIQIPTGLEANFEGIIDLLTMKAFYFEGDQRREKVLKKKYPTS